MRPVEKKKPGDIVRYTDSNNQEVEHTIQENYPKYGDAKFLLASNIGQYCSYCEGDEKIHSLEVEHMAAKSKGGSPTAWNNFLLCCMFFYHSFFLLLHLFIIGYLGVPLSVPNSFTFSV